MTSTVDDQARLFRILPDRAQAEAHELAAIGTLRDCAARLREISEADRDCYFIEMANGLRVTAEDTIRIAEAERD